MYEDVKHCFNVSSEDMHILFSSFLHSFSVVRVSIMEKYNLYGRNRHISENKYKCCRDFK